MASMPLVVAAVAGVLLVVVIGADVAYNRTLFVDVATAPGQTASWTMIVQEPCCRSYDHFREPGVVEVNRSDDVRFRLRIDNGYPLAYSESYVVHVGGAEVARGVLEAAPTSEGVAEFTIPATAFLGSGNPAVPPPKGEIVYCCGATVDVDGKRLYVSPGLREVAK